MLTREEAEELAVNFKLLLVMWSTGKHIRSSYLNEFLFILNSLVTVIDVCRLGWNWRLNSFDMNSRKL